MAERQRYEFKLEQDAYVLPGSKAGQTIQADLTQDEVNRLKEVGAIKSAKKVGDALRLDEMTVRAIVRRIESGDLDAQAVMEEEVASGGLPRADLLEALQPYLEDGVTTNAGPPDPGGIPLANGAVAGGDPGVAHTGVDAMEGDDPNEKKSTKKGK